MTRMNGAPGSGAYLTKDTLRGWLHLAGVAAGWARVLNGHSGTLLYDSGYSDLRFSLCGLFLFL